jgi:hypothetical protein
VRFLALNLLYVAGTVALVNTLFPVFAKNEGGIGAGAIGTLVLLNSLLIVGGQIPIARALEGHVRMRGLALTGVLFGLCWLLVVAGGLASSTGRAFALFTLAFLSLAVGECLYDSIQGPLTAALAPKRLAGRCMAAHGFSWQLGFIVGPGLGALVLARVAVGALARRGPPRIRRRCLRASTRPPRAGRARANAGPQGPGRRGEARAGRRDVVRRRGPREVRDRAVFIGYRPRGIPRDLTDR